jgi:hypothetical protein
MSAAAFSLAVAQEALVVFEDRSDARLLRWLRPGFRHCFCLTGGDRRWTLCDPLKSHLAIASIDGLTAPDLARRLGTPGRRVLHGMLGTSDPSPSLGLRPLTCVEIVKRLIGLQARSVVTPYQLYRRLIQPAVGGLEFIEIGLGEGGFGLVG